MCAENVDDFWLYGGDYPSDDGRKIEFGDQVIFDNPTSNIGSVEFLFDGKNWDKDKTMSLDLVLTPSNNKYKTIIHYVFYYDAVFNVTFILIFQKMLTHVLIRVII